MLTEPSTLSGEVKMKLSVAVKTYRLSAGLTQQQLATAADLAVPHISRIENGRVRAMGLDVLKRLAVALKVEPGVLASCELDGVA